MSQIFYVPPIATPYSSPSTSPTPTKADHHVPTPPSDKHHRRHNDKTATTNPSTTKAKAKKQILTDTGTSLEKIYARETNERSELAMMAEAVRVRLNPRSEMPGGVGWGGTNPGDIRRPAETGLGSDNNVQSQNVSSIRPCGCLGASVGRL